MPAKTKSAAKDSNFAIGFEAKLWLTVDKLRNNEDATEPSGSSQNALDSPKVERGGANQFSVLSKGNANFAWVQHFVHHLAPQGIAGFVLAHGSMSSNQSGEGDIHSLITSRKPLSFRMRNQTTNLEVAA